MLRIWETFNELTFHANFMHRDKSSNLNLTFSTRRIGVGYAAADEDVGIMWGTRQ